MVLPVWICSANKRAMATSARISACEAVAEGTVYSAPPCTRLSSPFSCSATRSVRMVSSVTLNSAASAAERTRPRCSSRRSMYWRRSCAMYIALTGLRLQGGEQVLCIAEQGCARADEGGAAYGGQTLRHGVKNTHAAYDDLQAFGHKL